MLSTTFFCHSTTRAGPVCLILCAMRVQVEAAVQARVAEATASEDFARRVQERLVEERAKLEEKVGG